MDYKSTTSMRTYGRNLTGQMNAAQLTPLQIFPVRENESGVLNFMKIFELASLGGRLSTDVRVRVQAIFVPTTANDKLKNPTDKNAGVTEVVSRRLSEGEVLFNLEPVSEISNHLGVRPITIDGAQYVSEEVRLAYNSAVNFCRLDKYHKADLLNKDNMEIAPAILSSSALENFQAVLNPEDTVDGSVALTLQSMNIPVGGIGVRGGAVVGSAGSYQETDHADGDMSYFTNVIHTNRDAMADQVVVHTDADGVPLIYANLEGAQTGNVSLTDFYAAERMDELARYMDYLQKAFPQNAEQAIQRWANGLSLDTGSNPFRVYDNTFTFGKQVRKATDSASMHTTITDMEMEIFFSTVVPKTPLGGTIICLASILPDETPATQPDPFLAAPWAARNHVTEELSRDPVPVTMRELDTDVALADEAKVAFYTGLNQTLRVYSDYGLNDIVDPEELLNKNSLWQYELPLSLTPSNINFPAVIDTYAFVDQSGAICRYTSSQAGRLATNIQFGPTPVETIDLIQSDDIFGDFDGVDE